MATAPEQDKPKATRNRAKTEAYDVFKATSTNGNAFELLSEGVEVTARGDDERRRLAIAVVTQDWDEEKKAGEFATCPAGEFVTMTRKRKVEPTDIWE